MDRQKKEGRNHSQHSPSASRQRQFESFFAKRFLPRHNGTYTGPLVRIATWSIALGVVVMIAAVCILRGFQGEIRQKVAGFGSHIVVQGYAIGNTYEQQPVSTTLPVAEAIRKTPGVRCLQFFATKGGMVKTENQIHGIILKGVDRNWDSTFFQSNMVEGRLFAFPDSTAGNEVIISKQMADKLKVGVGDKLRCYFWSGSVTARPGENAESATTAAAGGCRARALRVCGIYRTDLAEFDEHYVIGDLRQVQRLNGWDSLQAEGYEVLVENWKDLSGTAERILSELDYTLTLTTIVEENPALFSWLDLLDSNIVLIIILMLVVCTVSVISALLIMIFEKASTIGLLKALGTQDGSIRRIFLLKSAEIVGKGIAIGDAVALLLCWLQKNYAVVKLDSESYSMSAVPIDLDIWVFVAISLGTMAVCIAALLIPTAYISKVTPAKSMKFD